VKEFLRYTKHYCCAEYLYNIAKNICMGKRLILYGNCLCMEVLWTGLFSGIKGDVKFTGQDLLDVFYLGLAYFRPIHKQNKTPSSYIKRKHLYDTYILVEVQGLYLITVIGVCLGITLIILSLFLNYSPLCQFGIHGLLFEKLQIVSKHNTSLGAIMKLTRDKYSCKN
jgi:hypothetical protein